MNIWLSLFFATLIIQLPNLYAIKIFEKDPSLKQCFIIGLYFLPLSIISTAFFSYYYGMASNNNISYPVIAVSAVGLNMLFSFLIHHFLLHNKEILFIDYIGIFALSLGIFIIIFRDLLHKTFF